MLVEEVGLLVSILSARFGPQNLYSLTFLFLGTTDAIYLEKPAHYDLLIDLTTATTSGASSKNTAARPTLYSSKAVVDSSSASRLKTTYRLSTIRFAWSDVKLVCLHFFKLSSELFLTTCLVE